MYCPYCGQILNVSNLFCCRCGATILHPPLERYPLSSIPHSLQSWDNSQIVQIFPDSSRPGVFIMITQAGNRCIGVVSQPLLAANTLPPQIPVGSYQTCCLTNNVQTADNRQPQSSNGQISSKNMRINIALAICLIFSILESLIYMLGIFMYHIDYLEGVSFYKINPIGGRIIVCCTLTALVFILFKKYIPLFFSGLITTIFVIMIKINLKEISIKFSGPNSGLIAGFHLTSGWYVTLAASIAVMITACFGIYFNRLKKENQVHSGTL